MSHQEKKLFKLRWLMARIKACDEMNLTASKKKLIAEMIMQFGACERYIKETFQTLEDAGEIVIKEDNVYSKAGWEAEHVLNRANLNPDMALEEEH